MRGPAVAGGLLLAMVLAGGTGCRSCDEMGCTDTLRVTSDGLRARQTMEVCIDQSCVLANAAGGVTFTELPSSRAGVAEVRILIREGGVLVSEQRQNRPLEDFRPNGTGCPPTCKLVQVLVDERGFKEPLGGRIPH